MCLLPAPFPDEHAHFSFTVPGDQSRRRGHGLDLGRASSEALVLTRLLISRPPVNGNGHHGRPEEDGNNDDNLSPPPDSPMSSVPPNVNTFEDEIVVGTKAANGIQSSPLRVTSDHEDVEMEDVVEDKSPAPPYPKRKRASIYNELDEDKLEKSTVEETEAPRASKPKTHGIGGVKGVILGYWRDSPVPDEADKHAVIGFIDVRDRLRTRIQTTSRANKAISAEYPLPPGPGGSWVTFERVVFDKHLVNLDHNQVKEYVKIRAEALPNPETEEEARANEKAAVKEAIRRVQANPPPETATAPAIAYGVDIPEHAVIAHRPESKKRRVERSSSGVAIAPAGDASHSHSPAPIVPAVQRSPLDLLPGTRPTKILLGYWKGSSEEKVEDKHAVYGILGANDMFRVKVTRETRDGRHVTGNFPTGAGALWIHYDEVEMEQHLKHLARPEIKEYVRVRQRQLDDGEEKHDRIANETKAVYEAQARVTSSFKPEPADAGKATTTAGFVPANHAAINGGGGGGAVPNGDYGGAGGGDARMKREYPGHELRQSRRNNFPDTKEASRPARHSLPDASELRAANRPSSTENNVERANSIARREVTRIEAAQQRADQRVASREASAQRDNKAQFSENVSRLNKVWESQESNRIKFGAEDAKIFNGIKYERKQTGPFQGKLVSQGTIISIDGEDYVEYRVLTKPSFF